MCSNIMKLLALREVKAREPVRPGPTIFEPVLDEGTAQHEVLDPGAEGFEGGIGSIGPQDRHLVVEEGCVDAV